MLLAMVDDIRVILVKLADRLHNMRTLHHLPEERRVKIAQETRDIYAPIANRLGMSKIKNELEELAFKYLEPKRYEALRHARREPAPRDRGPDRGAEEDDLGEAGRGAGARRSRSTAASSACSASIRSCKRQKIELDQVYDFIALRIVTHSVKDCYAALGIIHQTWSPVPGRIKDFIAMPRPNGYQSLHTSVVSERGVPVRSADPHGGDAPHRRGRHRGALEVQGRARRRRTRRAVLRLAAAAARVAAGGARSAGVPAEPEDRALPRGGLHLHAARARSRRCRATRRRSTSPTPSTPTSATSASARGSTARWCRSAPACATATSSRSSRRRATSRAATG